MSSVVVSSVVVSSVVVSSVVVSSVVVSSVVVSFVVVSSVVVSSVVVPSVVVSSVVVSSVVVPSVVGSSSRKSFPGTLWNSPPFENTSLTTQPSQLCPRFTAASGAITVPNPLPANVMLPPNCPSAAELS